MSTDNDRPPAGPGVNHNALVGAGVDTNSTTSHHATRCLDCQSEAAEHIADGRWRQDAGASTAAIVDRVALAGLWQQIGAAHDEGARP